MLRHVVAKLTNARIALGLSCEGTGLITKARVSANSSWNRKSSRSFKSSRKNWRKSRGSTKKKQSVRSVWKRKDWQENVKQLMKNDEKKEKKRLGGA